MDRIGMRHSPIVSILFILSNGKARSAEEIPCLSRAYFWIGLALPNTGFGPATGAAQREALAITRLISGLK
jgi:hypothetical protein